MKPVVSVVLPVYNMADFIGEAIDSVLAQSFTDFELIIIDDASTDRTFKIVQSYKDHRISVISNESNIGHIKSRNKAMRIARGKYIAVMDSDDVSCINRLKIQTEFLEANEEINACGQFNDLCKGCISLNQPYQFHDIAFALLTNSCFYHSSLMVRHDVFRQLGYYDETYRYASDYNLLCKLALYGKIMLLPENVIQYRYHKEQITVKYRLIQKRYANMIRRKYQQDMIARYKCKDVEIPEEAELSYPDVGMAIFFFHYACSSGISDYSDFAYKTLHKVSNNVSRYYPVCLEEGLAGICCGLLYLIRNEFVTIENANFFDEINTIINARYATLDNDSFYFGKKGIDYYRNKFALLNIHK